MLKKSQPRVAGVELAERQPAVDPQGEQQLLAGPELLFPHGRIVGERDRSTSRHVNKSTGGGGGRRLGAFFLPCVRGLPPAARALDADVILSCAMLAWARMGSH